MSSADHHQCWNDDTSSSLFRALERVREQQTIFVRKVQEEMQSLLQQGMRQEEAVDILLKRIRSVQQGEAPVPSEREVSLVMRNHGLSRDDAVRALVVSNVMVNFRRQGWDSATAIEELTKHLTSHTLQPCPTPNLPPPSSHATTTTTTTTSSGPSLRKRPLASVSAESDSCPSGGGVKMDMYGRTMRSKTKAATDLENTTAKHMINKGSGNATDISHSPRKKGGARGGETRAPQKRTRSSTAAAAAAEGLCDGSGPQGALKETTIKRSRNE